MRRLGIFQMSDKDGIVEDYITYLLTDLSENLDQLVVVVNGDLNENEEGKLKRFTESIFFRENRGFDESASKQTVVDIIGIDKLREYDEVLLCNDTFYGPFYPFKIVFDKMEKSTCDFWGLTKHARYDSEVDKEKSMKEHIQSYFVVFRKQVLLSEAFEFFFQELDLGTLENEKNAYKYDVQLTDVLRKAGFNYEAYVKDDELNGDTKYNYNHCLYSPFTLVKKYKMPILKRNVLTEGKKLTILAGEEIAQVFQYIKECTSYDISLIWSDLLRKNNIADVKKNLNLNFVLSTKGETPIPPGRKVAVIAHITYEELFDDCMEYISNVPSEIDIFITSYKKSILEKVGKYASNSGCQNIIGKEIPNRGRDVAAIFVGCRDIVSNYDYVGFVHDKKTSGNVGIYTQGASFQSLVWENILKSEGYIRNIIELFEEEPKLGLLSPPEPLHAIYTSLKGNEWTINYDAADLFMKKMGLNVPYSSTQHPFALSTTFWIRRKALDKLFNYPLDYSDFKEEPVPMDGELNHVLERIIIYVAQDAGYYSGTVQNQEYASMELQNLYELIVEQKNDVPGFRAFKIGQYIGDSKKVFVYGAGIEATKVTMLLKKSGIDILGYIISDQCYDTCISELKPLVRLRDCPKDSKIIVALNINNSTEVKSVLEKDNRKDVLYMNLVD